MKKKIKLFCLPYAGGSAKSIYSKWKESLDSAIELHPVELAGRRTKNWRKSLFKCRRSSRRCYF
ncbi:thioesterase domain-containing protein [Tenacibaculum sp. nBUS_03]|uniref:thioesterase domain-containing protein n=1 Tax=Tenacibaculum sp. nBUS_03 TaxID=3395320 RepID=UPI003EC13BC1